MSVALSYDEQALLRKLVVGHLHVEGRGTLADAAGRVVVGPVARAVVAAPLASIGDGHTAKVIYNFETTVLGIRNYNFTYPKCVQTPMMTSHSASLTRSSSFCGSLNEATSTSRSDEISSSVLEIQYAF